MCIIAVLDHSTCFGCGHIFVAGVQKCPEAIQGQNQEPCVIMEETRFKPYSAIWHKYASYFDPRNCKVAGPCQACKDDGWPNFF
jgi:hypothetical protein